MKMALVPVCTESSFGELGMDGSVESLARLLDSQKKLFYSQVDQLHRVVVTHCKLTGANPLSQEMAAGALSIKIGKKPRDLLNPKAVKYMQSVFAIKDTIKKKETREISALCGVTVTQVKDFFSGQRSKVRKLVRLAREKAIRLDESKVTNDGCSANPEATSLCGSDTPLSAVSAINVGEPLQILDGSLPAIQHEENAPVSSVDAKPIQVISSSSQEEHVPGIDEDDKKFLENIFNIMRKEETFSGQVKLMEWILQIHNSAVLVWFSTKGSITILATWLSQAAIEEQTTVLYVILKVLCHLPLHKALPAEISTILQTVNKLRFYRTQDISNRARILLSRWSKMLVRSQALKFPSIMNSKNGVQKEIIRKQRINEILSGEFWRSKIGISENSLALTANSGNDRSGSKQTTKLITSSCDSSTRNQGQNVSVKIKERRTVRLVEQIDQKPAVRIAQVGRAAPSNHSRPISADDIQKAKMRAMYMQHKYGKADASSIENKKIEQDSDLTTPLSKKITPAPNTMQLEQVNIEEEKKAEVLPGDAEIPVDTELTEAPQEELLDRLKAMQVQWLTPLEMKIDSSWRVGRAEGSKELEVQAQRIRREKETFYPSAFEIPPNPKEPWDIEMDFDDSLTPEIPIEQPPDADAVEDSADHPVDDQANPESTAVTMAALPIASSCNAAAPVSVPALPVAFSGSATEPDLELLAALLKNPELVFALTSGQGKNLTNNERVALLDMIKHSNVLLTGAVNGMSGTSLEKPKETILTSLPSPTPPSDAERVTGWRSAFPTMAKAPLPQPQLSVAAFHSLPTQTHAPSPAAAFQSSKMPQGFLTANTASQSAPMISDFTSLSSSPSLPLHLMSSGYAAQQRPNAESSLPLKTYFVNSSAFAAPSPTPASFRQDVHILSPPSMPNLSSQHTFPPAQTKPQVLVISEPTATMFPPNPTSWTAGDTNIEWRDKMPDSSTLIPNAAEIPLQNPWFGVIDITHNDVYPRNHGRSTAGREDVVGRSLHSDSWSPESTPMRSSELRHGHGRSYAGSRNEQGWNHNRQGWSRRRPGHRNQHRSSGGSGGKWRDRDRGDRDNRDRR